MLATPLQSCADPKGRPSEKGGSGMIEISEGVLVVSTPQRKGPTFLQEDLMVI